MQPANQIAVSTAQAVRNGTQANEMRTGRELDEFARQNINDIFTRLQGIFPTWRVAYPTEGELKEAKKNWTKALITSGIRNFDQIKKGMDKARLSESPFFPTSGQFITWCTELPSAQALGMPEPNDAYREAISNCHDIKHWNPSHPAVYEAGRKVTWYELRHGDMPRTKPAFISAYKDLVKRVAMGEEIGGALIAHDKNETKPTKEQVAEGRAMAQSCIAEIRKEIRSFTW